MKKDVSLYLGSNVIKMVISILIMLPLTTYYLSVEEIGVFAYLMLLSSMVMIPLNSGGGLMINSYYFTSTENRRRELFFHLYLFEIGLKIISFIFILIIGEQFIKLLVENYKDSYLLLFYIMSFSFIFTATKPLLYHFFTVRKESKKFFIYNIIEISLIVLFCVLFLYYLELGLLGYILSTFISAFVMFIFDINVMRKYVKFKYESRWLKIIYKKGIRLFYANLIENFLNFYDSYIVQKVLNMSELGLYSHAKQYVSNFGMLDKAFFQSYSVSYIKMLNEEEKPNIFKITLFWYSFLLFVGICIIYFADDVISFLTHDKLTQSAEYLAIFYILIFFRSNQQQYSYQVLYNKENEMFVQMATLANIIGFLVLLTGVFVFNFGIIFIVFTFTLNVVLRNIFIKSYAIYKYRNIDISEVFFFISLGLYLYVFNMEFKFFS